MTDTENTRVWPDWLSRRETSEYLRERHGIRLGPDALANLATKGGGPPFHKDGGRLTTYWRPDVEAYAHARKSRRVTSTSELRSPEPVAAAQGQVT